MTLRKGQFLINAVRFADPENVLDSTQIDQHIFFMSDQEFEKIMNDFNAQNTKWSKRNG